MLILFAAVGAIWRKMKKTSENASDTDGAHYILRSEQHAKWVAFALVAVVFIAIIYVVHFSNTPAATQANKIHFVPLQQQRDLPEATPQIEAIDAGFAEATPRIEAVCFSRNSLSLASIGGKLVREGDTVDGFNILKIYPNRVEFEKYGKTVTGVFPPPRTSARPESDNFLQKQVGHKSSANYGVQNRQPSYSIPRAAENGTYYGQISENTGRPKTVYVRGYYRKDGTYVRSHYRSPPRR